MFIKRYRHLVMSGLVVATCAILPVIDAFAQQGQPPQRERPDSDRQGSGGPGGARGSEGRGEGTQDKSAGTGQGTAQGKTLPETTVTKALGGKIPPTAAARAKMLEDLYALLATAEDEAGAKQVQSAIERVWQSSGSATVTVLIQRALKAQEAKNDQLAGTMLDAAVDLAPDFAEGWNRRAFFFYKKNDYTRALGDLRRTLALDPNHFRALEGVATILRETGDERGAFRAYERLMEVNPLGEGVQKGYDELKVKVQGRGI